MLGERGRCWGKQRRWGGQGWPIKSLFCCSGAPHLCRLSVLQAHLGERSCRGVKGESLGEGDTPSILAGEPEEEPTLLRLPSNTSEDRLLLDTDKHHSVQRRYRWQVYLTPHYGHKKSSLWVWWGKTEVRFGCKSLRCPANS